MPTESSERSPPKLLWSFVETSLDEAAFLWTRWESALDAHDYTLAEVAFWTEERLLGALDGVRVAGVAAIEPLLVPALFARDPGLLSAAAYLLGSLIGPGADRSLALEALASALARADAHSGPALANGLARLSDSCALDVLWSRLEGASSHGRAGLLSAFAFARRVPTTTCSSLLDDRDLTVATMAAAVLPYLPEGERAPRLRQALASSRPQVRDAALDACLRLGSEPCWRRCRELLRASEGASAALLLWGAQLGASEELACIVEATQRPAQQRDALWALGFAGTRAAADVCLGYLRQGPDAPHARVAAEAFVSITGLEPARLAGCVVPEPVLGDDEHEPDHADPADEPAPTRDAGLALLDAAVVSGWWEGARARFEAQGRYLAGRPWSVAAAVEALRHGPTRRRHAIASELCARSAGGVDVQTRAFSSVQQAALTRLVGPRAQVRDGGLTALGLPGRPGE